MPSVLTAILSLISCTTSTDEHPAPIKTYIWRWPWRMHSSHAIMADVGIGDTAHAGELMRGDAVIVTGSVTGDLPKRPTSSR